MMYDIQEVCDDKLAFAANLTTGNSPVLSTKSVDQFPAGTDALGNVVFKDPGAGRPIDAYVEINTTALASGGAATLQVELIMADDAALSSNVVSLLQSAAIAKASLVAGYRFRLGRVPNGATKRYLGFRYTIATNDFTAGALTAALVPSEAAQSGVADPV